MMKRGIAILSLVLLVGPQGCSQSPQDSNRPEPPPEPEDGGVGEAANPWVRELVYQLSDDLVKHGLGKSLAERIEEYWSLGTRPTLCREIYYDKRYRTNEECSSPDDPSNCPRSRALFTSRKHNWHVQFVHFAHVPKDNLMDQVNTNWRPVMYRDMWGYVCNQCKQCFDRIPKAAKRLRGTNYDRKCPLHLAHYYFTCTPHQHPQGTKTLNAE